ncbi:MAG: decaprenyl-phosphate phosphoribosyltransferase [Clostridia bacterium]|nr:decaprenyl-phosphate phosphoribosyltransferase [Clostridia bacterium]
MKSIVKLLRPHHSIKNILLFLPLVFGGKLLDKTLLFRCIFGFVAFFFICSAVYVINDIRDAEKDRLHPKKCKRPIASGKISKKTAAFIAVLLVALAVFCDIFLCRSIGGFFVLLLYFVLNLGYSMGLKEVPLLDIVILVSGFILRVVYGSQICGIPVSGWMYLTVMCASFYLGLGKRRNELSRTGGDTRKVLTFYTYGFLDKNMYLCNTLVVIFYALWSTSAEITQRFGERMIWTVPLVMIILMKYSLDIEGDSDADPVEVVVRDKVLALLCLMYAIIAVSVIYFA